MKSKKKLLEIETALAATELRVYEEFEDPHESVDDLLKMTTRPRAEPVMHKQEELDSDDTPAVELVSLLLR